MLTRVGLPKIVTFVTCITAFPAVTFPAYGQAACGPREDILAALGSVAREQPEGVGLSQRGYILQLMTSDNRRTFSLVAIYADGRACVVDAGQGWEWLNKLDYPTFGDGT